MVQPGGHDERTLRVAMAQALVEPGRPAANLERAGALVAQAADERCDVVVLPECGDLGWTATAARLATEEGFRTTVRRYQRLAAEHGVAVVAGLTERDGQRLYNAAVAIDSDGHLVGRHRKINELDFARATYSTGSRLEALPMLGTSVGISICADNSASSLYVPQTLAALGARVILSPCAWAVPPGFDQAATPYGDEWVQPYAAIARQFGVPVVGVSNVGLIADGDWAGWSCIGCSLAVDREGALVTQLPYGEAAFEVVDLAVGP